MKILHLSKFYPPDPGGMEYVVGRLAEGAGSAGHEVRVISATGSGWARPTGHRLTEPPRLHVTVVRLPTHGVWWSQPVVPSYITAARWPADLVHLHHPHPLADLAALLSVRAPLVVTHHSDIRRQAAVRPLYLPLVRAALRRAKAIVVATPSHVTSSRELQGFEAKVRVIPFGVDTARFTPPERVMRPPGFPTSPGPVGLFVGRLVGYKGLDILLDALAGTTLRMVILGDGPLRGPLTERAAALGLGDRVTFLGAVSNDMLPSYYQAADYFVLPSTTTAEMFGIVLIEAMACGRPVISTDLPTGVREVNVAGETGLVVPVGDVQMLRQALLRLAGDEAERRRLGAAGRRRVEERFTLRQMVDAHLALYREVTGSR
jgi:rhamnosyl/mannosyltransferase